MNLKKNRELSIKTLVQIRDDENQLPAVRVQAIQQMQKMIPEGDPQTEINFKILEGIRDNGKVNSAVRIQSIQTLEKIAESVGSKEDDKPTEADIMKKIRSGKK